MRKLILFCLCMVYLGALKAQVLITFQTPPMGFTYKPQLWTLVLTNTTNTPIYLHAEVTVQTLNGGQQLLSGVTKVFTLPPGTYPFNASQLMPIQYNSTTSSFYIDPDPLGLMPLGEFEACYRFFRHNSDEVNQVAEQCRELLIEPLSPPQLVYPYDQTAIQEVRPQLSWLPPLPLQLFSSLRYDLSVAEILQGQSAAEAIQQNSPLYYGFDLLSNSIQYPVSASALQYGKQYAWRVTAKSGGAQVGITDAWQFELKQFSKLEATPFEQPFVQLRKDPETAYAIFTRELKFSYMNETSDSVWRVKLFDLSSVERKEGNLPLDTIALKSGLNLVRLNVSNDQFFINKHIYQIEFFNSRNEIWRLRFEYRSPVEANN